LHFGRGTFREEVRGGTSWKRRSWGRGGGEGEVGRDVKAAGPEEACVPLRDYSFDSDSSESFARAGILGVRRVGL